MRVNVFHPPTVMLGPRAGHPFRQPRGVAPLAEWGHRATPDDGSSPRTTGKGMRANVFHPSTVMPGPRAGHPFRQPRGAAPLAEWVLGSSPRTTGLAMRVNVFHPRNRHARPPSRASLPPASRRRPVCGMGSSGNARERRGRGCARTSSTPQPSCPAPEPGIHSASLAAPHGLRSVFSGQARERRGRGCARTSSTPQPSCSAPEPGIHSASLAAPHRWRNGFPGQARERRGRRCTGADFHPLNRHARPPSRASIPPDSRRRTACGVGSRVKPENDGKGDARERTSTPNRHARPEPGIHSAGLAVLHRLRKRCA